MKVLIVEDEMPAAKRLSNIILTLDNTAEIVKHTDSVESTVQFLANRPSLDLIFMDIQLADDISFSIFEQIEVKTPVIFTTAFDEYALKAFKVNSIDYLLKPIEEKELDLAIKKYKSIFKKEDTHFSEKMIQFLQTMHHQQYKERLLIKRGQQLSYLTIGNLAHAFADGKLCYAVDFSGNKFLLDNNLSQLEEQLPPNKFFRINRHLMINIDAITKVHTWLGGRLKIEIQPITNTETIVSRERVNPFKEWLGR
jgi:DNA-binding LytR/AlgR family response regulator